MLLLCALARSSALACAALMAATTCASARASSRVSSATTTLAAGVNLPASLVVIRSCTDWENKPISTSDFRQMSGRAGRAGETTKGEAMLMVETDEERKFAGEDVEI